MVEQVSQTGRNVDERMPISWSCFQQDNLRTTFNQAGGDSAAA
jgi:hypothetical protein